MVTFQLAEQKTLVICYIVHIFPPVIIYLFVFVKPLFIIHLFVHCPIIILFIRIDYSIIRCLKEKELF